MILADHTHPYVLILSLNRPDKRNALNIPLVESLLDTIEGVKDKRVLILKGEGPVFCSGLDLQEAADKAVAEHSSLSIARLLNALSSTPLITIAAVHGAAVAGGAGLMAACDFVLADSKTLFGFPEVRRGLVAAQVLPFLKRQLKERDLRQLLLLGELIDAERALEIGLINRIVDQEKLLEEALRLSASILQCAPNALAETKLMLEGSTSEELKKALEIHRIARTSDEAQEGISAFLEHRPPNW